MLPPDTWFEAIKTDFVPDIIHIYGFSAVVQVPRHGHRIPVILGAGTGSYSDLKYYHGWSESAIKRARLRKRIYLKALSAYDSSLCPESAAHVLTWSGFSRAMHLEEGYVLPSQISVLYPGLAVPETRVGRAPDTGELTFLFVGSDFERKNGAVVLDAFRSVHARYPRARLIVIGQPRDGRIIAQDGIYHRPFVPRDELLGKIFPQADVLLLPSRAEGFGLVIVEAMALGIPTIAIDAWAMPEIIRDSENGFLVSDATAENLADRMLRFASNSELAVEMSERCIDIFLEKFSLQVHNQQLANVYANAMSTPVSQRRSMAGNVFA